MKIESNEEGLDIVPIPYTGGPYQGAEGATITLNASDSYDPDGTILSYEWDFDGDGVYEVNTGSPTVEYTWGGMISMVELISGLRMMMVLAAQPQLRF